MSAAPTFPFSRHTWRIPADSVRFASGRACRRQPLYRLYQRASQPHEYQPQNETQTDVKTEIEPVFLLQEQVHVVGKRRKGGETAAEAGDQEDVHRR